MSAANWGIYIGGYFVGTVLIHYVMSPIVRKMWELARGETSSAWSWIVPLFGILDRTVYITALLARRYEMIPVWIGLKQVGRIPQFRQCTNAELIKRQYEYEIFLIGTTLSLGYAIITVQAINWALKTLYCPIVVLTVIAVIATAALTWYLKTRKAENSQAV